MKQLIILSMLLHFTLNCIAFTGGYGTSYSPYQISTPEDLHELALKINNPDSNLIYGSLYYEMINSINMFYDTIDWTPIGTLSNPFRGHFSGNNNSINYLTIINTSPSDLNYVGLFGYTLDASINSLSITDVNINFTLGNTTRDCHIGALIGFASSSSIVNCRSTGIIETSTTSSYPELFTGGLIGRLRNNSNIVECFSSVSITSQSYEANVVGGLIAHSDASTISYCSATGNVSATSLQAIPTAGGFVGLLNIEYINRCYATGNVHAQGRRNTYSGGFVGFSTFTTIFNCYAIGNVSASSEIGTIYAGGLMGEAKKEVHNCYARGNVAIIAPNNSNNTSLAVASGLIGHSFMKVVNCYSSGNVTVQSNKNSAYAAGIIGNSESPEISFGYAMNPQIMVSNMDNATIAQAQRVVGTLSNSSNQINNCYAEPTMDIRCGDYGIESPVSLIKGHNQKDGDDFYGNLDRALNNYVLNNPNITINGTQYPLYYWKTQYYQNDSLPIFSNYYTPSSLTDISEETSLFTKDGNVYFQNTTIGNTYKVYSLSGQLIMQGYMNDYNFTIQLPEKGIYIINDGHRSCKVVY